ncbi:UNVERIFIED_CONTAM: hypothetical protein K2H54_020970 [Gekko kuhli]
MRETRLLYWGQRYHLSSSEKGGLMPEKDSERDSPVSSEEAAVSFSVEEWALLDAGQRKRYWDVTEGNYETVASLVGALREMVSEKDSGRRLVGQDSSLQVEAKSEDQVESTGPVQNKKGKQKRSKGKNWLLVRAERSLRSQPKMNRSGEKGQTEPVGLEPGTIGFTKCKQ